MPAGHPWLACSRWHLAWRVAIATCATGFVVLLGWLLTVGGPAMIPEGVMAASFFAGILVPVVCALLTALIGPWLRRWYPFSQALMFGGITIAACTVVAFGGALVETLQYTCEPDTLCSPPLASLPLFWIIFALPLFLQSVCGYGLAIWGSTRRGARVFWPVFGLAFALWVTLVVCISMGVIASPAQQLEPVGPVCGYADASGRYIEVACDSRP